MYRQTTIFGASCTFLNSKNKVKEYDFAGGKIPQRKSIKSPQNHFALEVAPFYHITPSG